MQLIWRAISARIMTSSPSSRCSSPSKTSWNWKAPSAELRPGQKDSDSLPEYALLDQVLAMYIEHAHGRADLLADGFDEATVDTVMRLVDRAEWKRRQYPLGPKVTALAFGRDRRLPVTNAFRE